MISAPSKRKLLGYKTGIKKNREPDKLAQFLTGMSEAGERMFKMIYDWIYTSDHDEAIADHLRQKRNAKDVVKLPPISKAISSFWVEFNDIVQPGSPTENFIHVGALNSGDGRFLSIMF